jgi:hypothetical protein
MNGYERRKLKRPSKDAARTHNAAERNLIAWRRWYSRGWLPEIPGKRNMPRLLNNILLAVAIASPDSISIP